jgi:amino acid adenylation domain-containing protein
MLPDLAVQYADYAIWQRDWLRSGALDKELDYWRKQLEGTPGVLNLPADRPRPPRQTFHGAHLSLALSTQLRDQLKRVATDNQATLFMTLLAAWQVMLYRYTGQDDIVIGTPVANREFSELDNVIGFFLNTLAIRCEPAATESFRGRLADVRATSLAAFSHQNLPFEQLVEVLEVERDLSRSPLFQSMFVMQNATFAELALNNHAAREVEFETATTKFDLSLTAWELPDGLGLQFEYNTDLFDAATIERLAGHFETLLGSIVANPEQAISTLPIMDASEHQRVVNEFNATAIKFPEEMTPVSLFEAQVEATPDNAALTFGDRTLTYRELNQAANRLAELMRAEGAQSGINVAICCPRSLELAIAVLATVKSGSCYIPVDPTYPHERIEAMLTDSDAQLLLSMAEVELPNISIARIDLALSDSQKAADNLDTKPQPDDPLYCIYTSGSTGTPKGVQLTHGGLANLLAWQQREPRLKYAAKTLQFASISFDVSFQEMFGAWTTGGELVMVSDQQRQDLPALTEFIADSEIERLYLPFAALQPMAECWADSARLPTALRDAMIAGEQLKITGVIRDLFTRLPEARLHNHYGPSETHVITALTLHGEPTKWPELPAIGKPVANSSCYILDQNDAPVPVGVPGELHLGGCQVGLGYLNRADLNASKFIDNPFRAGERLYRTGDIARFLPDGNIEFLGRADQQVKLRGYRIEPGEIEARLNLHDRVEDARVILREDTQGDKKLVAYVVTPADQFDVTELRKHLQTTLPNYMVPQAIVRLDEIPLTANGKLNRRALPAPDSSATSRGDVARPTTPVEKALTVVWQQLLGVAEISIHDDFFELGGHSLLTIKLIKEVSKATGYDLSIADVFEQPTIAELAQLFPADVDIKIDIDSLAGGRRERGLLSRGINAIAGWFGRKAS